MPVTHVVTSNGRQRVEIPSELGAERIIRLQPSLLDGTERFATSLSRLPEGMRLRHELPLGWDSRFLQAAGSAEAMMVEVRKLDADGVERLYAIGRPVDDAQPVAKAEIRWRDRVDSVPANEVFDADEAGGLFWHYYQHDAIPDGYALRDLNV